MSLLALAVDLVAVALRYDDIRPESVYEVTFDFYERGGRAAVTWNVRLSLMVMFWSSVEARREAMRPAEQFA